MNLRHRVMVAVGMVIPACSPAPSATWDSAAAAAGYPEWIGRRAGEAPAHVQDDVAWVLYLEQGLTPWPTPARRCRG